MRCTASPPRTLTLTLTLNPTRSRTRTRTRTLTLTLTLTLALTLTLTPALKVHRFAPVRGERAAWRAAEGECARGDECAVGPVESDKCLLERAYLHGAGRVT